jgi:hypothetical protein
MLPLQAAQAELATLTANGPTKFNASFGTVGPASPAWLPQAPHQVVKLRLPQVPCA